MNEATEIDNEEDDNPPPFPLMLSAFVLAVDELVSNLSAKQELAKQKWISFYNEVSLQRWKQLYNPEKHFLLREHIIKQLQMNKRQSTNEN